MIAIKKVEIENFRSIEKETVELGDMNVFVGKNDAGKSNILKALNLAFNGETEPGQRYDHSRDFHVPSSKHGPGQGGPRQPENEFVSVKITFLRNGKKIVVEHKWNSDEKKTKESGDILMEQSQIKRPKRFTGELSKMKYIYVPAIKGRDYRRHLLELWYDSMSAELREQSNDFFEHFGNVVEDKRSELEKDAKKALGEDISLDIPRKLSFSFENLKIGTKDMPDKHNRFTRIFLENRGDGIQQRLMSTMLWHASKEHGKQGHHVVWGYEEPESNLEFKWAADKSEEFMKYAKERHLQILLTTHSPSFYFLKDKYPESVNLYWANKEDISTSLVKQKGCIEPHKELGLVDLIEDAASHNKELLGKINRLKNGKIAILCVEGKTDEAIYKRALEIFDPDLANIVGLLPCKGAQGVRMQVGDGDNNPPRVGIVDRDKSDVDNKKYEKGGRIHVLTAPDALLKARRSIGVNSKNCELEDLYDADVHKRFEAEEDKKKAKNAKRDYILGLDEEGQRKALANFEPIVKWIRKKVDGFKKKK